MPVMNEDQVSAAGAALFAAERDRSQTRLISAAHSGMDMDDAYAVQADFVARKLAAGGSIRGWKIGLTSKAMQYALNIDIPDSGVLFEDMFFDHGGTVPAGRFIEPRIEAEIAFIMDSDLAGAEVSGADVIAATRSVAPALEILDTRIFRADPETGAQRVVFDTISDNAANAGVVLGASWRPAPHRHWQHCLKWCRTQRAARLFPDRRGKCAYQEFPAPARQTGWRRSHRHRTPRHRQDRYP